MISLLLRVALVACVAEVLFNRWHPGQVGSYIILAMVGWACLESWCWNRVWDTRIRKTPVEAEDDAISRTIARYDRPNILR